MRYVPVVRAHTTMRFAALALLVIAIAGAACSRDETDDNPSSAADAAGRDEHSYAEPARVAITDLGLDLALDFDARTIAGTATYTLDWKDSGARQLVLDTRDLTIARVEGDSGGTWVPLVHELGAADDILGSRLAIDVPDRQTRVRVTYSTAPTASGLQWLDPAMTLGRRLPFMFSQSQQIHARSWVPLQDTPSVRYTYTAHITSRPDVMVLMSADNDPAASRDGDYTFRMPQPIPSYLMAIAAGDLVFRPLSARSGVWAEPGLSARAAAEFEDTERMIVTAESLYGPYRWERYDLLVLPPSFPYGGMENPRLTFLTPTVIVGDKSLVSLVAHELAHSWSGNLVTFATARHAWLNEGITTYVSDRLMEALFGADAADMERAIARNALAVEYRTLAPVLQVLALRPGDLADPDRSSSSTVYTKGAWFMQFLETRVGRPAFDAFLRGYFDRFAFSSIASQDFAEYARVHLLERFPGKVSAAEFDEWLHEPGIPATAPQVVAARFDAVDRARRTWLDGGPLPARATTSTWSTHEWVHLLEGLPETLPPARLAQLDDAFRFTGTPNAEVAQRWYPLAVRSGYTRANPSIATFLTTIGRRKLIVPTYTALAATDAGRVFARKVFEGAKPGYHPITAVTVQETIEGRR